MYDDSQYASEQCLTSINYVKDYKQYGVLMLNLKNLVHGCLVPERK